MQDRSLYKSTYRLLAQLVLLLLVACPSPGEDDSEMKDDRINVEALLWCQRNVGSGILRDGTEVHVPLSAPDVHACACLEIGVYPSTGSIWEAELIERGIENCEEILRAQGAITTNCEDIVPSQELGFNRVCFDPE